MTSIRVTIKAIHQFDSLFTKINYVFSFNVRKHIIHSKIGHCFHVTYYNRSEA